MRGSVIFRIYRGITVAILVFFFAILMLILFAFYYFTHTSLAQVEGKIVLEGLAYPVVVIRDQWGVPHIYAKTERDLFFASGFVQAQDRLFQMDLLRRVCEGRLSEWFGEVALASDRFARVVGFHRQAQKNLEHASDEARAVLDSYAAGVNAFIERRDRNLPLEYKALRSGADPWKPEDTLAVALYIGWGLSNDWMNELVRLGVAGERGGETMWEMVPLYQAQGPSIIPPGAWPAKDAPRPKEEGAGAPARRATAAGPVMDAGAIASIFEADRSLRGFISGSMAKAMASNSWAVDGSLSASGKPILANDPHLELTLPSVWYEIHLVGAGLDVIGVTFPGIPAVVLGHNRNIAWAATTTQADMEDLYIEELNPQNPDQYKWKGQWEGFGIEEEKIRIRESKSGGFKEETLVVRVGRHGPIINDVLDPEVKTDKALALSWTGHEVTDALGAFLKIGRAGDWESFREGIQRLGCPVQNWVYADASGNIAYIAAGLYPVRPRHNGTYPAPGSGGYEWQGFVPLDELPQFTNPESHYIVTANNQVAAPERAPYIISFSYGPPYRAERIVELLTRDPGKKLDTSDMALMQMDTLSLRARRLLPVFLSVLDKSRGQDEALERAWRHLKDWDCDMDSESSSPTIFAETWWQALKLTYRDEMSPELFHWFVELNSSTNVFDDLLESGESSLFDDRGTQETEGRDDIVLSAFRRAVSGLSEKEGPRMSTWKWGRFHRLVLHHPLGYAPQFRGVANFLSVNLSPIPLPGDRNTVNNGFYALGEEFKVAVGPSMRHIVDFGDPEGALMSYPGGQSGQPFSRHYSDMVELWKEGQGHPMVMSKREVEKVRHSTLELLPRQSAADQPYRGNSDAPGS
jgi:penicillin amidase